MSARASSPAHFNNDAKSDFLASCRPGFPAGSPPTSTALLNNGNGTYTDVVDTVAGSDFLLPVLVTDLNGDGHQRFGADSMKAATVFKCNSAIPMVLSGLPTLCLDLVEMSSWPEIS